VCVCGLEIPKVPVSFFVLHVAQIFDSPCQRGAFFYTYICLGIYLEKIFTHLANYLLIRPLKLPAAKKNTKISCGKAKRTNKYLVPCSSFK